VFENVLINNNQTIEVGRHTFERFSFRVQYSCKPTSDAPIITKAARAVS
jgi:hypothetical protein